MLLWLHPISIDFSFKGEKTSHNVKKLTKTKDQSAGPSSDKWDEEDLKQEEPIPDLEGL
jgi:hypothetical protein